MNLNRKKFLQGAVFGILFVFLALNRYPRVKPISAYDELCWAQADHNRIFYQNKTDAPVTIRCEQFVGCTCENYHFPRGNELYCEDQDKRVVNWEREVLPGPEHEVICEFSAGTDLSTDCQMHQLDITFQYREGQWLSPNYCSLVVHQCEGWRDRCLVPTPTLTPTPTCPEQTPSPTPTPPTSPTPTPPNGITSTPTPTSPVNPTPTPRLTCQSSCSSDSDCADDLRCQDISGTKKCVNTKCPTEGDCVCNKNCWDSCSYSSECPQNYVCQNTDGTWRCVNPGCNKEQDCDCNQPEVLGIEAPKVLPKAGFALNGFFLAGVIIFALRYLLLKI